MEGEDRLFVPGIKCGMLALGTKLGVVGDGQGLFRTPNVCIIHAVESGSSVCLSCEDNIDTCQWGKGSIGLLPEERFRSRLQRFDKMNLGAIGKRQNFYLGGVLQEGNSEVKTF